MVLQAGVLEVLHLVGAARAVAVLLKERLGDRSSEEQLAVMVGPEVREGPGDPVAGGTEIGVARWDRGWCHRREPHRPGALEVIDRRLGQPTAPAGGGLPNSAYSVPS